MPSQNFDFSQYQPIPVIAAPSLTEACKFKPIFRDEVMDYFASKPASLPDIQSELGEIRQGIADIKALFASRPPSIVYADVTPNRNVTQRTFGVKSETCECGCGEAVNTNQHYVNTAHKQKAYRDRKRASAGPRERR